jgi:hypothetical protein
MAFNVHPAGRLFLTDRLSFCIHRQRPCPPESPGYSNRMSLGLAQVRSSSSQ